ncbi:MULTISPECIES: IclR family transcriptional regulator [Subtercola]|uniref:IclR family transcriptional regulator n=1 Tax=Subtercola vilae TaxID=2056433 RepID=A0A4T2C038_9MICO|nr:MULTISPECIES: IclR family transcriptional regulator [Subtercola]MEA9984686.1 IclR family transcriptional regulator [Subtercola sp. RTI3]TIH35278.1 IclR family transcriptional regulator [Subtercola vilae]
MDSPTAPRRNSAGLRRDLELLETLGSPESEANGGLGVVRIAEIVGRDKGQVSRTLATLADAGLVARDQSTLNYRLGYQLYALAARTLESRLVREALPFLRRVVTATHETAHLCVLRGDNVLTLSSQLSEYAFRGIGWEGVSVAAWMTSSGRVLISDRSEADVRDWYDRHGHDRPVTGPVAPVSLAADRSATASVPLSDEGIPSPSTETGTPLITDFDSFISEITRIRERGYATVDEEFEMGVVGVSAPVFDFRGNIVAAINVSAPKARLGRHLDAVGELVASIAADLSLQLGAGSAQTSTFGAGE